MSKNLQNVQENINAKLSSELVRDHFTQNESWPKVIEKYLHEHEVLLLEAVSAGYGEGGGGSIWTYPGCILFAVSLLTTLGEYNSDRSERLTFLLHCTSTVNIEHFCFGTKLGAGMKLF